MPLLIVNAGRINSDTIMVEFSDESFVTFTVKELLSAKRFRETPEPIVAYQVIH